MADEEVEGLQELLGKLDALPLHVGQVLIARALRKGAEPIRERAADLAPADPTTAGSRIQENIVVAVTDQTGTEAIAKIGPSRKGFMGQFAEFGTSHQEATPFMRPAYDEKIDEAISIMSETLGDGIEKALKKQ